MLSDLGADVDEANERMDVVSKKLSKILQTKSKFDTEI